MKKHSIPILSGASPAASVRRGLAAAVFAAGLMMGGAAASAADGAEPAPRVEVGQEAPDFTASSSSGDSYSLGQIRGGEKHLVMIFFRGTW